MSFSECICFKKPITYPVVIDRKLTELVFSFTDRFVKGLFDALEDCLVARTLLANTRRRQVQAFRKVNQLASARLANKKQVPVRHKIAVFWIC